MHPTRRNALVVITYSHAQFMLQLRDDKPTIGHPNYWGLFGGKIEVGETPMEAAMREVQEELGLVIEPDRLLVFGEYPEAPNKRHSVFTYNGANELHAAVLMEGQRIGWFAFGAVEQLQHGMLDGHPIIPVVEDILRDYLTRLRADA